MLIKGTDSQAHNHTVSVGNRHGLTAHCLYARSARQLIPTLTVWSMGRRLITMLTVWLLRAQANNHCACVVTRQAGRGREVDMWVGGSMIHRPKAPAPPPRDLNGARRRAGYEVRLTP